jgi:hypothetical protein
VPISKWQILLLVVTFFIGVWAFMMIVLTHFSKTHTWLLPVFAVGLGAPRWCQVRCIHFDARQCGVFDGRFDRPCGERLRWRSIFLGRGLPALILVCRCGSGLVSWMPSRVSVLE